MDVGGIRESVTKTSPWFAQFFLDITINFSEFQFYFISVPISQK